MTATHKATPEQWEIVTGKFGAMVPVVVELIASCVHELRDRIAALEAVANSKSTPNPSQIRSSPAGGLMQSVGAAICTIADCGDTPLNWAPEARAAIKAVAGWLEHRNPGALQWAALLRDEVERHG